jgi:hypothetical protein
MTQFEVFPNPVTRARRSYPFVVVLQADVAEDGRERAVAPVAPRTAFLHRRSNRSNRSALTHTCAPAASRAAIRFPVIRKLRRRAGDV